MLQLGLSDADYKQFMFTLRSSHEVRVIVHVLDKDDHTVVSTISHLLLSGQIDCEAVLGDKDDIASSRTATLKFLDPKRSLSFTSDSPLDGAVYFDQFIRVIYSVRTDITTGNIGANGGWVDVQVFTGPITNLERDGDVAVIEASGKELFGLSSAFKTLTLKARTEKVDALRTMLIRMGESSGNLGDIPAASERLTKDITITGEQKIWPEAFKIVKAMLLGGRHQRLFYNARGQVQLKPITGASVATISSGDGGFLLSDPKITYSLADLKNVVIVIGRTKAGSAATVQGISMAAAGHPLSPSRLGRNGQGRYYLLKIDNPKVIGKAAAYALAVQQRNYWLAQQTEATFDCLPIPHLEPWDFVQLVTDKFNQRVPVRRFTLPLTVDAPMTIGSTTPVTYPKRAA